MLEYGYTKYEKLIPIGDCVLIEKLSEDCLRKSHGLYIPDPAKYKNNKIGVGKVLDLSKTAKEKLGLKTGDYVLYDYFSVFDDKSINVLTKYENIIMQLNEDEAYKFLNGEL